MKEAEELSTTAASPSVTLLILKRTNNPSIRSTIIELNKAGTFEGSRGFEQYSSFPFSVAFDTEKNQQPFNTIIDH